MRSRSRPKRPTVPKRHDAIAPLQPQTQLNPGGEAPEAIAERRNKALTLRKGGASYREIARECGVSHDTAWCDVQTELLALREIAGKLAEEVRELELRRLDDLTKQATIKLRGGSVPAGFLLLKAMERRAKLLGLDKPSAIDVTSDGKPFTILIGDTHA